MLNKKILSLILAFCITVGNIQGYALELDNVCPEKAGTYSHELCAFTKGKELLSKGNDYVGIKNVGNDAERSLHFFTYRALDQILDKFKIYSEEEIKKNLPVECQCEKIAPSKASKAPALVAAKLAGCTIGVGLMALINFLGGFNFLPNEIGVFPVNILMLILGGILGGSKAEIELKDTYKCVYSDNIHENIAKRKSLMDLNKKNIWAFEYLKNFLDFGEHQKADKDFIYFTFINSKYSPEVIVEFMKAGVKYTDEERLLFDQKFKELNSNLTKILENKKD